MFSFIRSFDVWIPLVSVQLSLFSVPALAQSLPDADASPTQRAEMALSALQIWYNGATGVWNTAGWWNAANCLTAMGDLARSDPTDSLRNMAEMVFSLTFRQAPSVNPIPGAEGKRSIGGFNKAMVDGEPVSTYAPGWGLSQSSTQDVKVVSGFIGQQKASAANGADTTGAAAANVDVTQWLDGYYDDDAWWALAWINAYDLTKNQQYLSLAEGIFNSMTAAWPTNCSNGGIWWSKDRTYANAIANELFLSVAAHLANRAADKDFYVSWAQRELAWFQASGMINENNTINDGLDANCKNNLFNTWSYNQGVILGGLVELFFAVPNQDYITLAENIANAAVDHLSDANGVIHDNCEPNCGGDASQFKGIFMRNLSVLHAFRPSDKFRRAIVNSANAIWASDRDSMNRLSITWSGPFAAPANASTQSSALDALTAVIGIS